MIAKGLWLNGSYVKTKESYNLLNPYNGKALATIGEAGERDVDKAVASSKETFGHFKNSPAHLRSKILSKTASLIEQNKEKLADTIVKEVAKPYKFAVSEVLRAVETFQFAAEEAKRIKGETVTCDASPSGEGRFALYHRFPVGVIAAISPFNFPLNLVAHKVAPAIAAGNTIVLKPTPFAPLTSLKLAEILKEAGLPDGVFNVITGTRNEIGEALVKHKDVRMITFTGSAAVGKKIKENSGYKKVLLELGSNSSAIVEKDADIDLAVSRCAVGGFAYAGQVCISLQRLFINKDIYDSFLKKFISAVKNIKIGDPMNKDTEVGPMITEDAAKRALSWIDEAKNQGGKILIGGTRKGSIVQPTVISNIKKNMKVFCEEAFAPIVVIEKYDDFNQALAYVNDSRYGLQTGIFTNNILKIVRAFKELEVGGVIINDAPVFRVDHMPYGGVKESGIGREGIRYAIEEMTDIKMLVIR